MHGCTLRLEEGKSHLLKTHLMEQKLLGKVHNRARHVVSWQMLEERIINLVLCLGNLVELGCCLVSTECLWLHAKLEFFLLCYLLLSDQTRTYWLQSRSNVTAKANFPVRVNVFRSVFKVSDILLQFFVSCFQINNLK